MAPVEEPDGGRTGAADSESGSAGAGRGAAVERGALGAGQTRAVEAVGAEAQRVGEPDDGEQRQK